MELIKLNFLRKSIITFIILLFSTIYIGCNQKQCWVCKGNGENICAICEDRNNNDCATKLGKKLIEKIKPTNILLEKSGDGNKRKPTINPIIIDKNAFFSDKFLL